MVDVAIQWKEFPKSADVLELPMTSPENYLYGISMETTTGSSGLSKWESCIYTKDVGECNCVFMMIQTRLI